MAGSRGIGQEAARPILEVTEVLQKMEITVAYVRGVLFANPGQVVLAQ